MYSIYPKNDRNYDDIDINSGFIDFCTFSRGASAMIFFSVKPRLCCISLTWFACGLSFGFMNSVVKDIAVLGAGVMGLSAAYACAKAGHKVRIFDPDGFPAKRSASYVAGGMLAPYAEIEHMGGRWIDAGFAGIGFWEDFSKGRDIGFKRAGSLLIAHREDAHVLQRFKGHLEEVLACAQELTPVEALEPELAERFKAGLYLEGEAQVHPVDTMSALVGALQELGADLITDWAEPEKIEADLIIDARGMGSSDEALRGVKGELLIVHNKEFSLSRPVRLMHPRYPLYIVPRGEGVFMIGATQVESTGCGVSLRSAMELMSALYSLHPSFGDADVTRIKSGVRPAYGDNLPRIKRAGRVVSCNGMFRHGFLLAPVMADIVRGMASGERAEFYDLFVKEENYDASNSERGGEALRGAA